jgi:hypothetical protein
VFVEDNWDYYTELINLARTILDVKNITKILTIFNEGVHSSESFGDST